jgi:hypothetical protein
MDLGILLLGAMLVSVMLNFATKARLNFTSDDDLVFKTAGPIAASAAVATIRDVGEGVYQGVMVIDVTALEIADNDEIYDIVIQGSPDSDFGTDTNIVDLCSITLAAAEVQRTDANADSAVGRYYLPFINMINQTTYRYLRLYTVVAGTVGTGINYTARAGKTM